mmetsp:Transcript_17204/g.26442  ORF Transcript_17204/g.26442 Transcript_17204/m.26442 type:complete len:84 (+) Transcript_17204:1013-1264(+)
MFAQQQWFVDIIILQNPQKYTQRVWHTFMLHRWVVFPGRHHDCTYYHYYYTFLLDLFFFFFTRTFLSMRVMVRDDNNTEAAAV